MKNLQQKWFLCCAHLWDILQEVCHHYNLPDLLKDNCRYYMLSLFPPVLHTPTLLRWASGNYSTPLFSFLINSCTFPQETLSTGQSEPQSSKADGLLPITALHSTLGYFCCLHIVGFLLMLLDAGAHLIPDQVHLKENPS